MNAATEWRTDEPPKDGVMILGMWDGMPCICHWRETREGNGKWYISGTFIDYCESNPDYWAHINLPSEA